MQHSAPFPRSRAPHRRYWLVSLWLCCLQLLPGSARAEAVHSSDPGRIHPPALDLAAATRVPLSVGPEISLELPGRLLLQAHVGWMPGLYGNTLTRALKGAGAFDASVAAVIDAALESVTTLRLVGGWRPLSGTGLELLLGYTRVSISGAASSSELLPIVSREAAARVRAEVGDLDLRLASSIHAFTIGAGWRWLVARQIVVRASIEYMQAFATRSSLEIDSSAELTRLAAPTAQGLLNQHYLEYIKVPLIGLCVGYRFF